MGTVEEERDAASADHDQSAFCRASRCPRGALLPSCSNHTWGRACIRTHVFGKVIRTALRASERARARVVARVMRQRAPRRPQHAPHVVPSETEAHTSPEPHAVGLVSCSCQRGARTPGHRMHSLRGRNRDSPYRWVQKRASITSRSACTAGISRHRADAPRRRHLRAYLVGYTWLTEKGEYQAPRTAGRKGYRAPSEMRAPTRRGRGRWAGGSRGDSPGVWREGGDVERPATGRASDRPSSARTSASAPSSPGWARRSGRGSRAAARRARARRPPRRASKSAGFLRAAGQARRERRDVGGTLGAGVEGAGVGPCVGGAGARGDGRQRRRRVVGIAVGFVGASVSDGAGVGPVVGASVARGRRRRSRTRRGPVVVRGRARRAAPAAARSAGARPRDGGPRRRRREPHQQRRAFAAARERAALAAAASSLALL